MEHLSSSQYLLSMNTWSPATIMFWRLVLLLMLRILYDGKGGM